MSSSVWPIPPAGCSAGALRLWWQQEAAAGGDRARLARHILVGRAIAVWGHSLPFPRTAPAILAALEAEQRQAVQLVALPAGQLGATLRALFVEGYRVAAPSTQAEIDDRRIVAGRTCPQCAGPLVYLPFTRRRRGERTSYRAFATCRPCGFGEEF